MTMQVSKGEFDRRVKLLEQKVRDSSNGLISRLQAETEAFIEKLRNTELDIENLKNEVTGTETNLDNLVTSFNNYKANTLRVNDVFDANGQFDGSKIKPLSIDTAAISVGQRSQQLTLTGVNFTVNDYSSGNGKLIWTSGTMFHYGFETEDGEPKLYTIYAQNNTGEYSFQNGNAHYIYAVFKRDTEIEITYNNIGTISKDYFDNCDSGVLFLDSAGTTPATTYNSETTYYLKQTETISNAISGDNIAYILVTTSKISVEGNIIDGQGTFNPTDIPGANYSANQKLFYIQLGYISGTLTGSNGYNYRKVDMTYGSTTINGRLITTGRIEGNGAYFDLDLGEIGGKITFRNTTTGTDDDINNIVDGTTIIAGGMISSNKILLKPLYDIIPDFSTSKAYYYLENNIYKQFPFVYTDGTHVGEIKEEFLIKGYNNIVVYPKNWGSDSRVYEYKNNTYEYIEPASTTELDDIVSAGICGEKSLPAFWSGGSEAFARNVATVRGLYPSKSSHDARKNAYMSDSWSDKIPDVFIDHDGFAKFGDFWVCDGVVSSDITVNLSGNKVAGVLPISKGGTNANSQSSAFTNIVAPGGTMTTGQIKKTGGGMWIKGRDNAVIFGNSHGQTTGSSWNTVWSQKTTNGAWTAGNLSGDDILRFVYDTDTNYNNNNNNSTYDIKFPTSTCKLAYLSDSDTYTSGNVVVASSSSTGAIKTSSYTISSSVGSGTANYLAYYNSSNQIYDTSKLSCDGNYLHILNDTDVGGTTTPTNAPFTIGTLTSQHIEIDANEILSKSNGTTPSTLYLQDSTGYVEVAGSGLGVCGINTSYNLYVNGTSYLNGNTTTGGYLGLTQTAGAGVGISLFSTIPSSGLPQYGLAFAQTSNFGKFGNVQGDWATYFTMYHSTNNRGWIFRRYDTSVNVASLSTLGNFCAMGGVTALATSSSDKRLKKEIKPFNAKQIIDKLSPVEFEWNKKANKYNSNLELNKKNYGLIAQDSDGIIDDLVFDLPDGKGYKGVRYEKLIPILLQAIKEQQKEINELKKLVKK